jgi:sugar/nucleoside kinase (ribokinase family)
MPRFDVSVVGELNLDLIFYGLPGKLELEREYLAKDFSVTLGSSSAIFAHNFASLGNRVGFSSSMGNDPLGEIALRSLSESGADVSGVRKLAGKLTGVTVILPSGAQRYILTYPGTMFEMGLADLDLGYVLNARHLHLSSYYLHRALRPQTPELFRAAKAAGLTVSLDTNDDPEDLWADDLLEVLQYVDVLLPNEREACKITRAENGPRAAEILAEQVPLVVMKRGKEGAIAKQGKEEFRAEPLLVEAADTVGAGDSFDAGFVHQYIRGAKIEECLRFASLTGALSVTRAGGTEAFRDREHRQTFLDQWRRASRK